MGIRLSISNVLVQLCDVIIYVALITSQPGIIRFDLRVIVLNCNVIARMRSRKFVDTKGDIRFGWLGFVKAWCSWRYAIDSCQCKIGVGNNY
jgi:hypothetical protein